MEQRGFPSGRCPTPRHIWRHQFSQQLSADTAIALVRSTVCSSIRMLFIMLKSYPWEFSAAWFGNARGCRGNSKCSLILQPTRAPRAATVQQNQTGPSVYSAAKHSLTQSGSNNYSFDGTSVEEVHHTAAGRSRERWRCAASPPLLHHRNDIYHVEAVGVFLWLFHNKSTTRLKQLNVLNVTQQKCKDSGGRIKCMFYFAVNLSCCWQSEALITQRPPPLQNASEKRGLGVWCSRGAQLHAQLAVIYNSLSKRCDCMSIVKIFHMKNMLCSRREDVEQSANKHRMVFRESSRCDRRSAIWM